MKNFTGVLEIDTNRGVIYFTPTEGEMIGQTVLRVCNVPTYLVNQEVIDISYGYVYDEFLKKIKRD